VPVKKSVAFEQLVARIVAELEPTAVVRWNDVAITWAGGHTTYGQGR
jgi:hypothetical protein